MSTPTDSLRTPRLETPAPPPARSSSRRERSAGHVVAIVIGVLGLLPALGILTGGIALAILQPHVRWV